MTIQPEHSEDLWVFGYGSLMWRPASTFSSGATPGWSARTGRCACFFCASRHAGKAGLVLGLDRGGNCRGIAYRVAKAKRDETIDYLREREQVTMVLPRAWRRVWLDDDPQRNVHALCLHGRPRPPAICRSADAGRAVALHPPGPRPLRPVPRIRAGGGQELETLGVEDKDMQMLGERLRGTHDPQ